MKPKVPYSKADPNRVSYRAEKDLYVRKIGMSGGDFKTFTLGSDERAARDRAGKLQGLWESLEAKGLTEWTDEALEVARAIQKGQKAVELEAAEVGGIRVDGVSSSDLASRAFTQAKVEAHTNPILPVVVKKNTWGNPPIVGQSLYDALDAYAAFIKATFLTKPDKVEDTKTTDWGENFAESVLRLKASIADIDLSLFGLAEIESIIRHWKARPYRKGSEKRISIDSVADQISSLKRFIKWCHKNAKWNWRKPADLDFEDELFRVNRKALMTDKEISKSSQGVATYTLDELKILWRYATQLERYYLVVGLNCAFAEAEHNSLRLQEVFFDENRIKRIRVKSGVYGEFSLWPETVAALKWVIDKRKTIDPHDLVLVNETGGKVSYTKISNTYKKIHKRIKKDLPNFRCLPFKYLRKTAGQMVQDVSNGEVAAVFMSRGKRVVTDELIDRYTRRPFDKVFEALATVRVMLQPMFDEGPALPFNGDQKGKSYISLGTTKKITDLLLAGEHKEEIARQLKVSRATVYREWDKIKPPKEEPVKV